MSAQGNTSGNEVTKPQHANIHNATSEYALTKQRRSKRRSSANLTALLLSGKVSKASRSSYTLAPKFKRAA